MEAKVLRKNKLIVMGLSLLIFLSSAGCSPSKTDTVESSNNMQNETNNTASAEENLLSPKETVETAMDAVKIADTKTFNHYIQHTASSDNVHVENKLLDDALDPEGKEFVEAVMVNFSYEIKKEEINGENAVVTVAFTNSDLSNIMGQLIKHAMTEKAESEDARLNQLILQAAEGSSTTAEVDLDLIKKDNMWKIILDDDDMNAICGNLFSGEYEFD